MTAGDNRIRRGVSLFFKCGPSCAILRPVKVEIQKHIEYASGYLDLKMFEEALAEADAALGLAPHEPHALGIKSAKIGRAHV